MKRLFLELLIILGLAAAAHGQLSNTVTIRFAGAPSGTCAPFTYAINNANADFYDCATGGTWNKVSGGGGGSGTVTSVLGTANQITSDGSTTTPTLSIPSTFIAPGSIEATTTLKVDGNGAASAPAVSVVGTPFTGGSGTTTFPLVYINSGTAPTTFSTSGTMLGVNAPSGFGGALLDLRVNGGTVAFQVSQSGSLSLASGAGVFLNGAGTFQTFSGGYRWQSSSQILSPSDGIIEVTNNAGTGFNRLQFGGTTSSFPALARSGTTITAQLGDGTAGGTFAASNYATVTNCAAVGTAASPSVVSCTAAAAGAFSCATNASAATCTVNTTAVTANSEIFVTEVADEGTRLSVTCNTAPTAPPAIVLASKSAGVSFTINVPTIVTNPACYDYYIVN